MQCSQAPFRTRSSWWRHGKIEGRDLSWDHSQASSLTGISLRGVVETCLLFTESVLRNQSPSFATEMLRIFSFLECASLIAVTRSGGEALVLLLNGSIYWPHKRTITSTSWTKQRIPEKTLTRRRSVPWRWLGERLRMSLAQLQLVPSPQHCNGVALLNVKIIEYIPLIPTRLILV